MENNIEMCFFPFKLMTEETRDQERLEIGLDWRRRKELYGPSTRKVGVSTQHENGQRNARRVHLLIPKQ